MCEAAEQRRLAAPPLPELPTFQDEELQEERIRVGRRFYGDWTDEDWWSEVVMALVMFFVAFAVTVAVMVL